MIQVRVTARAYPLHVDGSACDVRPHNNLSCFVRPQRRLETLNHQLRQLLPFRMETIAPISPASRTWLAQLVKRVGSVRSQLDFSDARSPETAEDYILALMLDQLVSTPFEVISKGLNAKKLDDQIPGLRSKASRMFGCASGIASYVLHESIRPDRSELTDTLLVSAAQALFDPEADHEAVLLELGSAYFNALIDDPCRVLQAFAWLGAHQSVELRESFVELYSSLDQRLADGLGFYLASWGRTPIDGVGLRDIATALTGLAEGLAYRTAVDPDSVDEDFVAVAFVALLSGLTRVDDRSEITVCPSNGAHTSRRSRTVDGARATCA